MAAVVDPGGDLNKVLPLLEREGLTLEKILLTHGHLDHAAATAELAGLKGVPIEGPTRTINSSSTICPGRHGNTALPRAAVLIRSIRENLFPLGPDVTFVPGHGPTSTFGRERQQIPSWRIACLRAHSAHE